MKFNDPAIKYEPKTNLFHYLNFSLGWLIRDKLPSLGEKAYTFTVNERIVEYPFVHSNTNLELGAKILDIGPGPSRLPLELAGRGYRVWTVDLVKYPLLLPNPNIVPVQGDIENTQFEEEYFDCITAVSCLEHVGADSNNELRATRAMAEINRILKTNGRLIITLPFGKKSEYWFKNTGPFRIYDDLKIVSLLKRFKIQKKEFAIKKGAHWLPAALHEVENVEHSQLKRWYSAKAVVMIVAQKTKNAH